MQLREKRPVVGRTYRHQDTGRRVEVRATSQHHTVGALLCPDGSEQPFCEKNHEFLANYKEEQ